MGRLRFGSPKFSSRCCPMGSSIRVLPSLTGAKVRASGKEAGQDVSMRVECGQRNGFPKGCRSTCQTSTPSDVDRNKGVLVSDDMPGKTRHEKTFTDGSVSGVTCIDWNWRLWSRGFMLLNVGCQSGPRPETVPC